MREIRRRVARLEQKLGMRVIATDERDPLLVELMQRVHGDQFKTEMVPLGVSANDVMALLMRKLAALGASRFPVCYRDAG